MVADLGELGVHTTARSYDAAGRPTTVTDAHGGVYRYTYDAAGRPVTLEHPHGVTTSFGYDAGGDLTELETVDSEGEVLQSYNYTLDATNRRRAVEEHDGTTRSWGCAALVKPQKPPPSL